MKEFIEWMKSLPTNKFSLPYLFFFLTYNWPIPVYIYNIDHYKNKTSLFRLINTYLINHAPCTYFVPAVLCLIYVIASPWISFVIDWSGTWPNRKREISRKNLENEILSLKNANLDLQAESLSKEDDLQDIKKKSASNDARIFTKLNSLISENELRRIVEDATRFNSKDLKISPSDAEKIREYLRTGNAIENEFDNHGLNSSHQAFLDKLGMIGGFLAAGPISSGADRYYIIPELVDLSELITKYREYRKQVKELLEL